jgi:hypothetical protein
MIDALIFSLLLVAGFLVGLALARGPLGDWLVNKIQKRQR